MSTSMVSKSVETLLLTAMLYLVMSFCFAGLVVPSFGKHTNPVIVQDTDYMYVVKLERPEDRIAGKVKAPIQKRVQC